MRARRLSASVPLSDRPERRRGGSRLPVCARGILAALALACAGGVPLDPVVPELTAGSREVYARTYLERARALRAEGRLEAAASAARRGLEYQPEDARLHRLRAALLEELGRDAAASLHRARADELQPPPPAPPETPHELAAETARVLVVLLPPAPSLLDSPGSAHRVPRDWPAGPEAELLARRVGTRLPNANVIVVPGDAHPASQSVARAKQFLAAEAPEATVSLRLERAFCGSSVKDGNFAVAWLRVATAVPGRTHPEAPHLVRVSLDDSPREGCKAAAISRAFERALELRSVRDALASGPAPEPAYAAAAVRSLFPVLGWRLEREVLEGRRHLAVGDLARAVESFERAAEIDPADPVAAAFLDDALRSLALARLLAADAGPVQREPSESLSPPPSGGAFDPQLSLSQRLGMEAQLAYESRRREEMLSALAVLYELRSAPTPGTVANMRPAQVQDPTATGIALALPKVPPGSAVEVRTLFAPDGDVLARYYFAENSQSPILREEDRDSDGTPDRWVGYEEGVIREVWESTGASGPPTLHVVYSPGGDPIERIELDHDGDGRLERVFVYDAGRLREESSDTNGDGAFDRFQRFDNSGSLTMREEDVDGDEEIDVRTAYTDGRIVRREILNPKLLGSENSSDYQ